MLHGKYIGPIKALQNDTALLQFDVKRILSKDMILAQFDNREKHGKNDKGLAYGWHPFFIDNFIILDSTPIVNKIEDIVNAEGSFIEVYVHLEEIRCRYEIVYWVFQTFTHFATEV